MGDEIENANVITVTRIDRGIWEAKIGPDGLGYRVQGYEPIQAVTNLMIKLVRKGWPFDESWTPKP